MKNQVAARTEIEFMFSATNNLIVNQATKQAIFSCKFFLGLGENVQPVRVLPLLKMDGNDCLQLNKSTIIEIQKAEIIFLGSLDGKKVIVRQIFFDFCNERIARSMETELRNDSRIQHENALRTLAVAFDQKQNLYVVYENFSMQTLHKFYNKDVQTLVDKDKFYICQQLSVYMLFLHLFYEEPILHNNLTPHNIVVDENDRRLRVRSCGALTNSLNQSDFYAKDEYICYWAPEVLYGYQMSVFSDMWMFGNLVFQMFAGAPAFKPSECSSLEKY